jgi:hypothetical protein
MANQPKRLLEEVFTAEYKWILPIMVEYTPEFEQIHRSYGVSNPVIYKGKQIEKGLGIFNKKFQHKYSFSKSNDGAIGAINTHTGEKQNNDILYSNVDIEIDDLLNSFREASQYFLVREWSTVSGVAYSLNTNFVNRGDFYTYDKFFVFGDEINISRNWVSRINFTKFSSFKNNDSWLHDSPFGATSEYLEKTTLSAFFGRLREFENTLFSFMSTP